jgi:cytochrome c biogenesis protein CcmG, thiol:disulfide interchange protein DsbE
LQDFARPRRSSPRADDGSRTRDLRLGKPTLYQLSYVRAGDILSRPQPAVVPPARAPAHYPKRAMRRYALPGLVACAAVALLALLAFGVSNQGTNGSIDAAVARGSRPAAPNANLALPVLGSAGTERLDQLRGKVVVLNVFASWCDPCRAEAPVLEQAEHQFGDKNATILGVTYLDNSDASAQFVRQEHITYPVVRDTDGKFVRAFGTTGVPETFVIDRQGRIAAVRRYQVTTRWLDQTLPSVLAQRS